MINSFRQSWFVYVITRGGGADEFSTHPFASFLRENEYCVLIIQVVSVAFLSAYVVRTVHSIQDVYWRNITIQDVQGLDEAETRVPDEANLRSIRACIVNTVKFSPRRGALLHIQWSTIVSK